VINRLLAVAAAFASVAVSPHLAGASQLPAGLPTDAPIAATSPQPTLPNPSTAAWPFPNAFPRTSGAGRLARGAALWTSFVYDDHGAALPGAPPASEALDSSDLAPYNGAYVYSNAAAHNNGADIFRAAVGLDAGSSYWRVDWNTLTEPRVPIAEWTFDTDNDPSTGVAAWPAGAGVRSPGIERALLVSSRGAWLIDPATGVRTDVVAHGGALRVDPASRSFIVRVPRSLMPVANRWRVRLAAGVANPAGDGFATAALAGGAPATALPAIYDVAFRTVAQEPPVYADDGSAAVGTAIGSLPPSANPLGLDGPTRVTTGNFWMEDDQSDALMTGDVSKFSLVVDWANLAARTTTPQPQPVGYSLRWYVTRFKLGAGLAADASETQSSDQNGVYNNLPSLLSPVQPYAVYVPTNYSRRHPAPLTFILHALDANFNQYGGLDPRLIQQLCEHRDSICVMPEGLGPGLDWQAKGQADLWQVWRAVAGTYAIDPNRTVVAGYSMGGSGVNIMTTQHPDAFAGALVLDGPESFWPFANARWVPFVLDESVADVLAPSWVALQEADKLAALGQRYQLRLHAGGDHILWATEDRFDDAVAAIGMPARNLNPATFSYTWTPLASDSSAGVGATGDYWVGGLRARSGPSPATTIGSGNVTGPQTATLTVDDHALPARSITATPFGPTPISRPTPGIVRGVTWRHGPRRPLAHLTTITLANVAQLTINVIRARMRTGTFDVTSDGPATLRLVGLRHGTVSFRIVKGRQKIVVHAA
jgi:dienelactone hydrolase